MKPPSHPLPSGDRTIGRLLIKALESNGYDVRIASELRAWSPFPDDSALTALKLSATGASRELLDNYLMDALSWRPQCWVTYHNYYKAPDLLGPIVADTLDIPYVIVEASYSSRRATGEWSAWLRSAQFGIERADAIFSFTARDKIGLSSICKPELLHDLSPFLPNNAICAKRRIRSCSTANARTPGTPIRLISVAMMREGAKLASYQILADALRTIEELNWTLEIIGDGTVRPAVESAFSNFAAGRVTFRGTLEQEQIYCALANSHVFAWPGVEEAFGMAFLEAQAAGLPVAAVRTAGVPEVVRDGVAGLLAPTGSPEDYAATLRTLINDEGLRRRLSKGALTSIEQHHSLTAAAGRLSNVLDCLVRSK